MEGIAKNPLPAVIAGVVVMYVANKLSIAMFDYPFAFCWGEALLKPVLEPWFQIVKLLALLWLAYRCLQMEVLGVVQAMVTVVVIYGLPLWVEIIFRQGSLCR